jgi:VanZ family protein
MSPPKADAASRGGAVGFLHGVGRALTKLSRPSAVLPLALWSALIWFFSSKPPRAPADHANLRMLLGNCAHAVEFGLFALLVMLVLPRVSGWPRLDRRGVTLTLVLTALYATIDELHQGVTPGRNAAVPDVMTDLVGAACTVWIVAYVARPDASEAGLAGRFGLGLLACFTSGAIATMAPEWLPGAVWV